SAENPVASVPASTPVTDREVVPVKAAPSWKGGLVYGYGPDDWAVFEPENYGDPYDPYPFSEKMLDYDLSDGITEDEIRAVLNNAALLYYSDDPICEELGIQFAPPFYNADILHICEKLLSEQLSSDSYASLFDILSEEEIYRDTVFGAWSGEPEPFSTVEKLVVFAGSDRDGYSDAEELLRGLVDKDWFTRKETMGSCRFYTIDAGGGLATYDNNDVSSERWGIIKGLVFGRFVYGTYADKAANE
ncbi:MAG: hypothetical protein IJV00_10745, partial [Clostridia bacterium]|nr:hypothetical protein [Clostridia bacterium]